MIPTHTMAATMILTSEKILGIYKLIIRIKMPWENQKSLDFQIVP
jgi:hypothetical protein